MYKAMQRFAININNFTKPNSGLNSFQLIRTFLSQAYYCQEAWEKRLNSPIFQKINLDELYYELDQRFQKSRQLSAVDVDIFANATNSDAFIDELLDIVHKLRLTADTGNTLNSTGHAVIRILLQYKKHDDLLNVLDDRLNYGLFLDYYTSNILMDSYWKSNDFTSGARVASQLMLQEEYEHPISRSLSLLHCYNYLSKPGKWPIPTAPVEPEEEIKVRVKYLRNPYNDDHFDLKEPDKIVGKTLAMFCKQKKDSLNKSLGIVGWALYNKNEKVLECAKEVQNNGTLLYKEVLDLVPDESDSKNIISQLPSESADVEELLISNVKKAVDTMSEKDIADQCETFSKWEAERMKALEEQKERLTIAKNIKDIEDLKTAMKEKETKLWFFENEEKIEFEIEEALEKMIVPKTKKKSKVDDDYIPPEVHSRQSN
ncbi:uncharacterized protein [Leptinotarsa decemlineata]|uniref:uncharacterized protein n=1 Tax=Leptinotarsa decemlineata TaxID=7539 RepID=UPI000C254115|nr:uncharacterized protein LOC111505467 [Leptinotarsa decemlineata]